MGEGGAGLPSVSQSGSRGAAFCERRGPRDQTVPRTSPSPAPECPAVSARPPSGSWTTTNTRYRTPTRSGSPVGHQPWSAVLLRDTGVPCRLTCCSAFCYSVPHGPRRHETIKRKIPKLHSSYVFNVHQLEWGEGLSHICPSPSHPPPPGHEPSLWPAHAPCVNSPPTAT